MTSRKITAAALTTAALAAVAVGPASPASAAVVERKCATMQDHTITTPGHDVTLELTMCVERDSTGVYRATSTVWWTHGGWNVDFEKLEYHLRLERYDVVKRGAVCDLKAKVNSDGSGSSVCQVAWTSTTAPVTADGTFVYNHNNDGEGDYRLELTGSPSI
ncbi:hypothetical protein ACF05T_09440 [Streptomyces lateritius]|uniref:Secreted protein n=1 Tax=Streptomyces lateritius TaxID=67313 RepID=A0ABW6Y992_9ACTN